MLKNVLTYIKSILTRTKCECGNPKSCRVNGGHNYMVLYDVEDDGPFTIGGGRFVYNKKRGERCYDHRRWLYSDPDTIYR